MNNNEEHIGSRYITGRGRGKIETKESVQRALDAVKQEEKKITGAARPKWTDSARSTAEQIEWHLRKENREMRAALESILANCEFVRANSSDKLVGGIAEVIERIAKSAL